MRSALAWMILLFAGLSWIACWEELQIVRMRAQMTALRAESAGLRERLGEMAEGLQATRDQMADVGSKLSDAARAQSKAEARLASLDDGLRRGVDATRGDAASPDYADALAQMKLSPDVLAKLKGLLVARDQATQDARDAASKEGIAPGSREMESAVEQAAGDFNHDIAKLLGPDGFRRLEDLAGASVRPRNPLGSGGTAKRP